MNERDRTTANNARRLTREGLEAAQRLLTELALRLLMSQRQKNLNDRTKEGRHDRLK
jgi:hypothetical protein